jgi:hypothetical protein
MVDVAGDVAKEARIDGVAVHSDEAQTRERGAARTRLGRHSWWLSG